MLQPVLIVLLIFKRDRKIWLSFIFFPLPTKMLFLFNWFDTFICYFGEVQWNESGKKLMVHIKIYAVCSLVLHQNFSFVDIRVVRVKIQIILIFIRMWTFHFDAHLVFTRKVERDTAARLYYFCHVACVTKVCEETYRKTLCNGITW